MEYEAKEVVLKPKDWVKTGYYISAVLFVPLSVYLLYSFYTEGIGETTPFLFDLSLVVSAVIILIAYAMSLPAFHKFRITLDDDGINRSALKNKSIPYSTIEAVIVRKGGIEVLGDGILNRISFGNLYTNFDRAHRYLAEKVKNLENVDFKGSNKHVEDFLARS